jgi:hypothetical protein
VSTVIRNAVIRNAVIGHETTWTTDGLTFTEMCRQGYGANNCIFSTGTVEGHSVDTVYLRWEKDGDRGGMLLLRPDEMAAIAWVCNGTLWSELLGKLEG